LALKTQQQAVTGSTLVQHDSPAWVGPCIGSLGLAIGFGVGTALLASNPDGQVNLLYLLSYFAVLPAVTLIISVALLSLGKQGFITAFLQLPLWPRSLDAYQARLSLHGSRPAWMFMLSQLFALCFSLGSLGGFLLMLVGSDLYFVWRSTLLDADNLLPVLESLAWPWRFMPQAQPSLELLQQSRDVRIAAASVSAASSDWWRFILGAQLCYGVLPRTGLWLFALIRFRRSQSVRRQSSDFPDQQSTQKPAIAEQELAELINRLPPLAATWHWGDFPTAILSLAISSNPDMTTPTPLMLDMSAPAAPSGNLLVLVKSWEPPLGDLSDLLKTRLIHSDQQLILGLLNWNGQKLCPGEAVHIKEWRRFAATFDRCSVIDLGAHT
jgi:hypothetical protein